MIPEHIAPVLRRGLASLLSVATSPYFAHMPQAQRDAAEIREAIEWLEQETGGSHREPAQEYAGPIVHEGLRWPDFGTHRRDYDGRRR